MATEQPLSRLVLHAASVADDVSYVGLADIGRLLGNDPSTKYRIIGGHMVTALVARWRLGAHLYRETGDTDLGVPPVVIRDGHLVEKLMADGYQKIAGNRFSKSLDDVPLTRSNASGSTPSAIIDVLVPSYTSRARDNRRISDNLVTTEVPGLATALKRPPVLMDLELHRLNNEVLQVQLPFPDEVASLVLKSAVTLKRHKSSDVVDVWRCLEAAYAAKTDTSEFTDGDAAKSALRVEEMFAERNGSAMTAVADQLGLSPAAADERFTRIRALMGQVLGPPDTRRHSRLI